MAKSATGGGEVLEFVLRMKDEATKVLAATGQSIDKIGKEAKQTQREVKQMGTQMDALGRSAGFVRRAMVGLFAGVAAGMSFRTIIRATAEAEAATKNLESVLASTGRTAEFSIKQLQDYASELQAVSGFSDEMIQNTAAILLQFKNLQGDQLFRAVDIVADVAARTGRDMAQTARILGIALQAPIEGMASLRSVGVVFNEVQRETIKNLVETGRLAEAQAAIFKALEDNVGGAAEAYGKSLGGSLAILRETWNDLAEEIGQGGLGDAISQSAKDVTKWLNENKSAAREFGRVLGEVYKIVSDFIGLIAEYPAILAVIAIGFGFLMGPVAGIAAALGVAVVAWAAYKDEIIEVGGHQTSVGALIAEAFEMQGDSLQAYWDAWKDFTTWFNRIDRLFTNAVIASFETVGDVVILTAKTMWEAMKEGFDNIYLSIIDLGEAITLVFEGEFTKAGEVAAQALNRTLSEAFVGFGDKVSALVSENFSKDYLATEIGLEIPTMFEELGRRSAERFRAGLSGDAEFGNMLWRPGGAGAGGAMEDLLGTLEDLGSGSTTPELGGSTLNDLLDPSYVSSLYDAWDELGLKFDEVLEDRNDYVFNLRNEMIFMRELEGLKGLTNEQYEVEAAILERNNELRLTGETISEREIASIREYYALKQQLKEENATFAGGFQNAIKEIFDVVPDYQAYIEDAFSTTFSSMSSALDQFVETGKISFSSLATSIIQDLARIALQAAATSIFSGIGNFLGGLFGSPGAAVPGSSGYSSGSTAFSSVFNAHGNAFQNGKLVPMAKGGMIVSQPTIFPMAKGAALVGEGLSDEAVLPLKRMPSGNLGVESGGNRKGAVNIGDISVVVKVEGERSPEEAEKIGRETARALTSKILQTIQEQQRSGGILYARV